MTPEALAGLHGRAFAGQGRAWSAGEFAGLLDSPLVFAVGDARGFALGRVIAGEAELLTIATAPEARRQGVGRGTLALFEAEAVARGAGTVFLEVAEDNTAARGLYAVTGYEQAARREGYYPRANGSAADALILRKALLRQG
ncbi:ribosomal-protein-alanine N-acetyltransferase [Roseovarius pacificus]|uniref:Ribosomal-protein-alanine N-acetyltransferase n=1 Tax=Roseovarius pacificus TaxID=337701 RepID=A0A1M7B5H8_9RHOB|nr:GNAT family N-acetyltransferase [Roseovarius pacificus]GGO54694.1 alanine acetyltransferase [Roseovarius pacificus]SHL50197.1 ribosomal-protein-alanine N-acetyltransferase [Roseovarius pacificus]